MSQGDNPSRLPLRRSSFTKYPTPTDKKLQAHAANLDLYEDTVALARAQPALAERLQASLVQVNALVRKFEAVYGRYTRMPPPAATSVPATPVPATPLFAAPAARPVPARPVPAAPVPAAPASRPSMPQQEYAGPTRLGESVFARVSAFPVPMQFPQVSAATRSTPMPPQVSAVTRSGTAAPSFRRVGWHKAILLEKQDELLLLQRSRAEKLERKAVEVRQRIRETKRRTEEIKAAEEDVDTDAPRKERRLLLRRRNTELAAPVVKPKSALLEAVGSYIDVSLELEEANEKLEAVLSMGGIDEIKKQRDAVLSMGGIDEIKKQTEAVLSMGGIDEIKKQTEAVLSVGGIDEIKKQVNAVPSVGVIDEITKNAVPSVGDIDEITKQMEIGTMVSAVGDTDKIKQQLEVAKAILVFGNPEKIRTHLGLGKMLESISDPDPAVIRKQMEDIKRHGGLDAANQKLTEHTRLIAAVRRTCNRCRVETLADVDDFVDQYTKIVEESCRWVLSYTTANSQQNGIEGATEDLVDVLNSGAPTWLPQFVQALSNKELAASARVLALEEQEKKLMKLVTGFHAQREDLLHQIHTWERIVDAIPARD